MTPLDPESVPRLAPGCRLSIGADAEAMLLIPEGALRLIGPGRQIVELCDGERTMGAIISVLRVQFASEDPARIEAEVKTFLARLHEKRVIDLT